MSMSTEEQKKVIAGRYRLDAELGAGTFGRVYRASDLQFQPPRQIAIKLLREQFLTDATVRDQFVQEASNLASFNHPNILSVYDFGLSGETAYIVTPLAENGSLADVIKKQGRLSPEQTGRYLEQIADAIEYAHSRKGVIHRDLKPQNILLDEGGRLLVADLGLAKIVEGSSSAMLTDVSSGTPAYMSPEQWQGHVGRPNDIYAIGVILFEMLTGSRPFKGNQFELMGQHLNAAPPSVTTFVPQLPAALDKVIEQALAKDPKARPRHATELVRLYREAFQSSSSGGVTQPTIPATAIPMQENETYEAATTPLSPLARPETAIATPPTPPAPAASVTVAASPPTSPPSVTEIAAPANLFPLETAVASPAVALQAANSPATALASPTRPKFKPGLGLYLGIGGALAIIIAVIAFVVLSSSSNSGNSNNRNSTGSQTSGTTNSNGVRQREDNLVALHSPTNNVTNLAFSPDGKTFFSASVDKTLRFWTLQGLKDEETATKFTLDYEGLYPLVAGSNPARLAVTDGDKIRIYDLQTNKEISVISKRDGATSLAYLNQNKTLLVADYNGQVSFWNTETGQEQPPALQVAEQGNLFIAASSDSKMLISGDSKGQIKLFDLESRKEIISGAGHTDAVNAIAFAPNGQMAISVSADKTIKIWDVAARKESGSITTSQSVECVAIAPDSKTFATGSTDAIVRVWNLADRREITNFVGHGGVVRAVAFSPDGKTLISGAEDNSVKVWKL